MPGPGRAWLLVPPVAGLVLAAAAWAAGQERWAGPALGLATLPVLAALVLDIARGLRAGDAGLDLIAALSMGLALAMEEPLASSR